MKKKLLILVLSLIFMPVAYATNAASIKINISGTTTNNRYFLCLPSIGCLSLLAAKKGKVYPVLRDVKMNTMYVLDTVKNFQVKSQGLPMSCNVTVKENQTITISGHLANNQDHGANIANLRCSVS